jgi:hypothetical protein
VVATAGVDLRVAAIAGLNNTNTNTSGALVKLAERLPVEDDFQTWSLGDFGEIVELNG